MRIARIDETLDVCQHHLNSSGTFGTQIESLLTYSILVIMYAEFEQNIESILQEKCASIGDGSIRSFVESCLRLVSRNIRVGELAGLLGRFGDLYKTRFNEKCSDNPRARDSYSSIITNRHATAHSSGSTASFLEVKGFYEEGHIILDFFRETLLSVDAARLPEDP